MIEKNVILIPFYKGIKMYTVYILFSNSIDRYYIGSCADFEERFGAHNAGTSRYTKRGIPWIVVKLFKVDDRKSALLLETKIKKRGARRFLMDL